ncbi:MULTISPECIES: PadR family transcriptional regulator [Nitrosomonas]|uniref:PadR family transcriptional regulator n=1 Tax=Nitrosomonas communis TaxID=44574 RepID=A0A0F7KEN1_9PROT|nr:MULTISPECIES: helix-turn-helix transcriptional regulator [Nitrosomonas]AKH37618.1 PadR family transcriptional regulator [Nitrosomonas communis]TYP78360.1 DNA-binding PadR family transcriptional regulator [Nitrosomonas communis]UVS62894.1 PadR family transcriptional regulator [Nitrosomonas sp. PLL12]
MTDEDFYSGLIRLHILPHAAEEPIFSLGIIKELRYHGYKISTGTLYPMLHGLEKKGYFTTRHERPRCRDRRVDEITKQGRVALTDAKVKVKELFRELIEGVDVLKEIVDGIA